MDYTNMIATMMPVNPDENLMNEGDSQLYNIYSNI